VAKPERSLQEVKQKNNVLTFTKQEIETIRRTVAKGATDDEFRMFMHLAKTYGLDPFNKEIWFIKYVKKGQNPEDVEPTIMTSRDGYLKIADRHPEFDGLVSDVVREGDKFRKKMDGVEHEYSTNRGKIIGAYALVYRKDRKYPIYVFAPFDEYKANTRTWAQYPSAMILKVAESMALKRAFTVSGLVSKEEMEVEQEDIPSEPKNITPKKQSSNGRELTEKEKEIKELIGDNPELRQYVIETLRAKGEEIGKKIANVDDLSDKEYEELKLTLEAARAELESEYEEADFEEIDDEELDEFEDQENGESQYPEQQSF